MKFYKFVTIFIIMFFIFTTFAYAQEVSGKITDVSVLDLSKLYFSRSGLHRPYLYLMDYERLTTDPSLQNITLDLHYVENIRCKTQHLEDTGVFSDFLEFVRIKSNFSFDLDQFNKQLKKFMEHYSRNEIDTIPEFVSLVNNNYSRDELNQLGDLRMIEACNFEINSFRNKINRDSDNFTNPIFKNESLTTTFNLRSFQENEFLLDSSRPMPIIRTNAFPIYAFAYEVENDYFSSYITYFDLSTDVSQISQRYPLGTNRQNNFRNLEISYIDLLSKSSILEQKNFREQRPTRVYLQGLELERHYESGNLNPFVIAPEFKLYGFSSHKVYFITPLFIDVSIEEQLEDVKFELNPYYLSYNYVYGDVYSPVDIKTVFTDEIFKHYDTKVDFLDVYLIDMEQLRDNLPVLRTNHRKEHLDLVLNHLVSNRKQMLNDEMSITKFLDSRTEYGLRDDFFFPYSWAGEKPPSMKVVEDLKRLNVLVPRKLLLSVSFTEKESSGFSLIEALNLDFSFLLEIDTSDLFLADISYPKNTNKFSLILNPPIETNKVSVNKMTSPQDNTRKQIYSMEIFRNKNTNNYNVIKLYKDLMNPRNPTTLEVYLLPEANSRRPLSSNNKLASIAKQDLKYFLVDNEVIAYSSREDKIYYLNSNNNFIEYPTKIASPGYFDQFNDRLISIEKYNGNYYLIGLNHICVKSNISDSACSSLLEIDLSNVNSLPEYNKFNSSSSDFVRENINFPTTIHDNVLYILGINPSLDRVLYSYDLVRNEMINYVLLDQIVPLGATYTLSGNHIRDLPEVQRMYVIEDNFFLDVFMPLRSIPATFVYPLAELETAYYTYGDFLNPLYPKVYRGFVFENEGQIYALDHFAGFDTHMTKSTLNIYESKRRNLLIDNFSNLLEAKQSNIIIDDDGNLRTIFFDFYRNPDESLTTSVNYLIFSMGSDVKPKFDYLPKLRYFIVYNE